MKLNKYGHFIISSDSQKTKNIYRFGVFRLDAEERRLWRDDAPIHLTTKQFDLLLYFVENAGRITLKSELLDAVWDDTYIEEATLMRNVSWLRKTLGEFGDGETFIETVPKFGYRFAAPVESFIDEEEYALIIEEKIVQRIRGEETIEFDDNPVEREDYEETEIQERPPAALLTPTPYEPSRFPLSLMLVLITSVLIAVAGSAVILYRNYSVTSAPSAGLNVKTTITVKNITVDATRIAVDTGLKVLPGDVIRVSAMGVHRHGTEQSWTLAGDKSTKAAADFAFPKAAPWSLVAWVGTESDRTNHFQVSENPVFEARGGGHLYLTINDRRFHYANNQGGLTAAVVLYRTDSIYAEDDDYEAAWGDELVKIFNEDTLAIRGRGDVAYWEGGELYDLNGSDHETEGLLAPTINTRSLIGKIGSRTPFKVGMNFPQQTMNVSGWLYLSVNDQITGKPGAFKNNSGEITVDIEINRQPENFKNPI